MDFSQASQLRPCDYLLPVDGKLQPPLSYPDSEGYSSLSPASSTDSYGLSPPYLQFTLPMEVYGGFCEPAPDMPRRGPRPPQLVRDRKGKSRVAGSQRYSASEREKMRMRNLSKALQGLRRYLPPSVAPAGKSLTKIETLQLTIGYISHLSELLGLSEEALAQRKDTQAKRCNLCPEGLGCSQARAHPACALSPAPMADSLLKTGPCHPPLYGQERPGQTDSWFNSSCYSEKIAAAQQHRAPALAPGPQLSSPHYGGQTNTLSVIRHHPYHSSPSCGEMRTHPVNRMQSPLSSPDSGEMRTLSGTCMQSGRSSSGCGEIRMPPLQRAAQLPLPHQYLPYPHLPEAELRSPTELQKEQPLDSDMLLFFPGDYGAPGSPEELALNLEEAPSPASPDLGFCQDILDEMCSRQPDQDLWTSLQS
ncbi:uncharacterized protein LOC144825268 [Lissotriton helveticus]